MGSVFSMLGADEPPDSKVHSTRDAQQERQDVLPTAKSDLCNAVYQQPTEKSLSKRAQKRLAKEEKLRVRKKARREEEKSIRKQRKKERKEERLEALAQCDPEERERILKERIEVMRAGRASERAKRDHIRHLLSSARKYGVCIDLGWNAVMTDKERKSLARQLVYSYSALRKGVEDGLQPLAMSIVGLDELMKPRLTSAAAGWDTWPVVLSEKSLMEYHANSRLVYLTHDSENVIEKLDEDCVYVIGGIVDRNRLKGATASKAKQLGIPTARFNVDDVVQMQHGTRVLTVNHCLEILLQVANGTSWRDAYIQVLPERKGLASSNNNGT